MAKMNRDKYRLVYNEQSTGEERILVKKLNSYDEANIHKQYYKHLGYDEEHLEIRPFI